MAANALLSPQPVADDVHATVERAPLGLLARLNRIVDRMFGFELQEEEIVALTASADDTTHRKAPASNAH